VIIKEGGNATGKTSDGTNFRVFSMKDTATDSALQFLAMKRILNYILVHINRAGATKCCIKQIKFFFYITYRSSNLWKIRSFMYSPVV